MSMLLRLTCCIRRFIRENPVSCLIVVCAEMLYGWKTQLQSYRHQKTAVVSVLPAVRQTWDRRSALLLKLPYSFWLKHENYQYIWICADWLQPDQHLPSNVTTCHHNPDWDKLTVAVSFLQAYSGITDDPCGSQNLVYLGKQVEKKDAIMTGLLFHSAFHLHLRVSPRFRCRPRGLTNPTWSASPIRPCNQECPAKQVC